MDSAHTQKSAPRCRRAKTGLAIWSLRRSSGADSGSATVLDCHLPFLASHTWHDCATLISYVIPEAHRFHCESLCLENKDFGALLAAVGHGHKEFRPFGYEESSP